MDTQDFSLLHEVQQSEKNKYSSDAMFTPSTVDTLAIDEMCHIFARVVMRISAQDSSDDGEKTHHDG